MEQLIHKTIIFYILISLGHSHLVAQTCKVPFSLSFSERTTTSVKLKWFDSNINPLGWEIEIVKRGQARSGNPSLPMLPSREVTISNLTPGTAYELYIRTVCTSTSTSIWNVAIPFITVLDIPLKCGSNIPLKDNGTEVLLMDVKQEGILGVDVFLESVDLIAEHDWPADLQLTLETPQGQQVVLTNHNGINTDDFGDITDTTCKKVTTFAPNACFNLKDSKPPYIGAFKMDGSISDWKPDTLSKGYWRLISFDRALKDIGALKYLNIKFNTVNCLVPEDFTVTKTDVSSITVSWKPQSSCNTVKISVFRQGEFINGFFTECASGTFNISKNLLPNENYEITIGAVCSFGNVSQESCRIQASTTCEPVTLSESFDTKPLCQAGCSSPCQLTESLWYNTKEDGGQDWIVQSGKTDTPNSGPSGDVNGNGKYIYIENNPAICSPGVAVRLQSECIHVMSNASGCDMSFYYHMYGADISSLKLEISTDNGTSWNILHSVVGNQGDKWQRVTLSLKAYHNQIVLFRFVAVSSSGVLNDIAIDQIEFYKSVRPSMLNTYFVDNDGDGYGVEDNKIQICSNNAPKGYAAKAGDCNDQSFNINPGVKEIQCNGVDENCNGNQDDKATTNPINISFQVTKTSCNGSSDGNISLNINGGNAPYDITWNNTKKGITLDKVSAGTYFAEVKDVGGCIAKSDFIEVTPASFLNVVAVEKKDVACLGKNDGHILVEHSTGNSPYTYLWSNNTTAKNLINIAKGKYSLTVTDSRKCQAVLDNINVDAKPKVVTDVIEVNQPLCSGQSNGSITLQTISGSAPYKYLWNTGSTSDKISGLPNGLYHCTVTDNTGCQSITTTEIKSPPAISGKVISTENVRCQGESNGSIKTDITGGKPPYSYLWNNFGLTDDIFGLKSGGYVLSLTDGNGCKFTLDTIRIEEPKYFDITVDSISPSTCILGQNGFIRIRTTGGNGNYNYSWSHSEKSDSLFNNISSGNYSVTSYDKLGCKASIPSIFLPFVNDEVKIQIDLLKENTCFNEKNGVIAVNVNNDKLPFDYNWSYGAQYFSSLKKDTIRSIPSGRYNVTVTDNKGCTGVSNTLIMGEKPPFFYTVSSIRNNICNNDSAGFIKINVSGGTPPYGILWNGGLFSGTELTKLPSDIYKGIISDIKGCRIEILPIKIESEGNIKLNSQLFHDINNTQSGKICLSPTGGIPPYHYLWSSQNKKDSCLVNIKGGDYIVTITDGSGCISVHTFRIENVTSLADREDLKVRFYPNPATDILTIESDKKIGKIRLHSIEGLLMHDLEFVPDNTINIDIGHLKPGIYSITIFIEGKQKSKPLVILR